VLVKVRRRVSWQIRGGGSTGELGEDVALSLGDLGALAEGPARAGEGPDADWPELTAEFGPGGVAGALSDVASSTASDPSAAREPGVQRRHRPSYPSAIVRTGGRLVPITGPIVPRPRGSADHAAQGPAASHTTASPTRPKDTQNGHSRAQSTVDRARGPVAPNGGSACALLELLHHLA
jgi:hypothetical protein